MGRRYTHATSLLLIVAISLSSACAPAPTQPATQAGPPAATVQPAAKAAPAEPFEVVVALAGEPTTLDQTQRLGAVEGLVGSQIFDSLLEERVDGRLAPALAESWQFTSDGLSVTLKLRRGVTFHDGTPFNAEAVKFNYERQLDRDNEHYGDGTWRLVDLFIGNLKLPVVVVDEATVTLNFKEKLAPDLNLQALASAASAMVSPAAVRASRKEFGTKPVGTGPFKFVSWEKGQRIVLEKNAAYWGTKAQIDRLIIVPIPDPDARLAALRSGTADINTDVGGAQLETIRTDPNVGVVENTARHIWEVLYNLKVVPQLQDKRVRQALNYAVNKEAIVRDILRGSGTVARGPMSKAFGDYQHDALPGFPHDPAKAKQLLAEAGFPDGRGFPQLATLVPTNPALGGNPVAMAEAIQADLAAVGVKITLEPMEFAAWRTNAPKGEFQLTVFSQNVAVNDPDNALFSVYHSSRWPPQHVNYGWYKNDEFDRLAQESRTVVDRNERIRIVKRMQEIIAHEDPPALWIEHGHLNMAFNKKRVKSMQIGTHSALAPFNLVERP